MDTADKVIAAILLFMVVCLAGSVQACVDNHRTTMNACKEILVSPNVPPETKLVLSSNLCRDINHD